METKLYSRRGLLRIAAAATAGGVLAACQPKVVEVEKIVKETVVVEKEVEKIVKETVVVEKEVVATPKPADEKVELTLWWSTSLEAKAVVDAYSQANPNVEVHLSAIGENVFGDPKYLTAVAAGAGPDVASQNRHTFGQFAARKLYMSIEAFFAQDGLKREDFYPTQIGEVQFQGELYGLPVSTDTRFLFYNKKDYREVGLDPDNPPTTWVELDATTEKLLKRSGDDIDRFGFIPWNVGNAYWIPFVCNGAVLIAEDGHKIPANDPDTWVEALAWIVSVYDRYCGGAGTAAGFLGGFAGQAVDPFMAGKLSQVIHGNWVLGTYAALPDLEYGMVPFPVGPHGKKSNISCGYSYVMAPDTEKKQEAWHLLKWMIGPDAARAGATVGLAETKKRWQEQDLPGEPVYVPGLYTYKPTVEAMEAEFAAELPPKIKADYDLTVDALNWTNGCGQTGLAAMEYYVEIDRAVQNVINHKAEPQQALDEATDKVQRALDAAWAKVSG